MIKDEQIPISDEAVEAAARKQAELDNVEWHTLNDVAIKLRCDHARAVLAAGLAAWPRGGVGMLMPLTSRRSSSSPLENSSAKRS
jgi:hypothetical protein